MRAAAVTTVAGFLLFLSLDHSTLKLWDTDHFATFRSNEMGNYFAPELVTLISEFTDVLFYGEGLETIVSVTNVGERHQSLVVNGMKEDFSWNRSARRYLEIYHSVSKINT